jgi:hypothetical protein
MDITGTLAAYDPQQQQQQLAGMVHQPMTSMAMPINMAQLQQQVGRDHV